MDIGKLATATFAEDVLRLITTRADEIAHVLNHTGDPDTHPLEHAHRFLGHTGSNFLGSGYHHGSRQR